MKIRIQGNSLRLRLKVSEIETLKNSLSISDEIDFSGTKLKYSLEINNTVSNSGAVFLDNEIKVMLSKEEALHWINSEEVSIVHDTSIPKILIEKDFKCTSISCEESNKDQSDYFKNPAE